ncbi:MAG: Na+/H+ antiporter NhaA [Gammaproteobacteria bacterium]
MSKLPEPEKLLPLDLIKDFFKLESASGILLVLTALLAIIVANSPLNGFYQDVLNTTAEIRIGYFKIDIPLLLWINDGLMAIFFFLVGLELKRELIEGELSEPSNIMLPGLAAIGGMLIPALIYTWINWGDEIAMSGWAIPAATDIAFALGILLLLGDSISSTVKVFLVSIAIIDDIGAIVIIALFYTQDLSVTSLIVALAVLPILIILNKKNVTALTPYIFIGAIMWVAVLKSGVHATLAGVILAFFIPLKDKNNPDHSPLKELEHDLHTLVAYGVLPLFAFANAGVNLTGVSMDYFLHPVPLGIALGLFLGKQIGVFGFCWLAIKSGMLKMPNGMNWGLLYGVSLLCGVGFTMSLFIGSLAFGSNIENRELFDERLGIILGSLTSGILGYLVLRKVTAKAIA